MNSDEHRAISKELTDRLKKVRERMDAGAKKADLFDEMAEISLIMVEQARELTNWHRTNPELSLAEYEEYERDCYNSAMARWKHFKKFHPNVDYDDFMEMNGFTREQIEKLTRNIS